jgi:hypothetical protein
MALHINENFPIKVRVNWKNKKSVVCILTYFRLNSRDYFMLVSLENGNRFSDPMRITDDDMLKEGATDVEPYIARMCVSNKIKNYEILT